MSAIEVSVAAASAGVGTNLLADSPHAQSSSNRRVRAVGAAGSAAGGDTEMSVLVNAQEVARIFNTTTGFPTRDHLKSVGFDIPANAEIACIVIDAPATNPINVLFELQD